MKYVVPLRLGHSVPEGSEVDELVVFLMHLPDGPPVALEALAALIWLVAADGAEDVPAVVADQTDRSVEEMRDQVNDYLDDLVERGLLVAQ